MVDQTPPVPLDSDMITCHLDLMLCDTEGFAPVRILKEKNGTNVRNILPFEPVAPVLASRVIAQAGRAASTGTGTFVVPGTVDKVGTARGIDIDQMTCLLVDLDKEDIAAARTHLEMHLGHACWL